MSITAITIAQDNKVGVSDLLPIHSPLVFLANAEYTAEYPTSLFVDVIVDGSVVDTFRAIPYRDLLANLRQFAFVATDVLKTILGTLDDFFQPMESLAYCTGFTKVVTLRFYDPITPATMAETTVTLCHGANQFGEQPNLESIYINETSTYFGAANKIVYVYFYNEDPNNILTIDNENPGLEFAQDFDDVDFTDFDDVEFLIDTTI
jgi:hypothetical protein